MIKVIRSKRIYNMLPDGTQDLENVLPAGEHWVFDGKSEVRDCCTFLWGRDRTCYLVFRNGFNVSMKSGDLSNVEKELNRYE